MNGKVKTTQEIKTDEIMFRELFNNMSDCVAIYEARENGKDFIFKDFNKAAERVEKIKRKDVIGKSVLKVFPGVKEFGLFDIFKKVWKTGEPENHPITFYKDNRISGWRENYVYKLPSGEVVAIYRDLTELKKAENVLRVSEERFQEVAKNAARVIWEVDRNGLYTYISPGIGNILGYKPEEVIGKKYFYDFFSEDKKEELKKSAFSVFKKKQSFRNFVNENVHRNGNIVILETTGSPVLDSDGNLIGYRGGDEDITERKKMEDSLRESEVKYRTLVEAAQDAIFIADIETGIILDANKKAEELLGQPRKDIIGIHQTDLHPKEDIELYKRKFQQDAQGEKGAVMVAYVHNRNGYNIPVQINANVVEINGKKVLMGIFRDITDLKKTEEVLQKEKIGLEKIAGEKTLELRKALKELDDAKRLSDIGALAATIAHELRNPLGVIRTAVYNIKNKTKDPGLKSHLLNIDKKIMESDQIIKNLLAYSKMNVPYYESVVLHDILNECISIFKEKYSKGDVTVTVKCDCKNCKTIEADPLQLTELFSNILDNAYQSFPDKKGKIKVVLECNRSGNRINVIIEDNGIGIDERDLPSLFDRFFTTRARGIGLGLTVCKQIVNLHGGEISIKSEKDKGTTVYVSLPVSRDAHNGFHARY